jgi:hypothetical protein
MNTIKAQGPGWMTVSTGCERKVLSHQKWSKATEIKKGTPSIIMKLPLFKNSIARFRRYRSSFPSPTLSVEIPIVYPLQFYTLGRLLLALY